jgi:hypothetical protein
MFCGFPLPLPWPFPFPGSANAVIEPDAKARHVIAAINERDLNISVLSERGCPCNVDGYGSVSSEAVCTGVGDRVRREKPNDWRVKLAQSVDSWEKKIDHLLVGAF